MSVHFGFSQLYVIVTCLSHYHMLITLPHSYHIATYNAYVTTNNVVESNIILNTVIKFCS